MASNFLIYFFLSLLFLTSYGNPIKRQTDIIAPPPLAPGGTIVPPVEPTSQIAKRQTGTTVIATPIGGVMVPSPTATTQKFKH